MTKNIYGQVEGDVIMMTPHDRVGPLFISNRTQNRYHFAPQTWLMVGGGLLMSIEGNWISKLPGTYPSLLREP